MKNSAYITLGFTIRGVLGFVWPGNIESALLSNIADRECFSGLKRKFQTFKLIFPLTECVQSLPQPGKEDRIILVETFTSRGCVGVSISFITGS